MGVPIFFRWERLESTRFDNLSAAIICVDTIKYHSIPSVPSRLEGKKKTYPFMRTPSLFYLGYTEPHSILSRPNQRPINVEYFQAQHPSWANQPRAFTSDSIQALVTT